MEEGWRRDGGGMEEDGGGMEKDAKWRIEKTRVAYQDDPCNSGLNWHQIFSEIGCNIGECTSETPYWNQFPSSFPGSVYVQVYFMALKNFGGWSAGNGISRNAPKISESPEARSCKKRENHKKGAFL
jgi:hypothetical protein